MQEDGNQIWLKAKAGVRDIYEFDHMSLLWTDTVTRASNWALIVNDLANQKLAICRKDGLRRGRFNELR